MAEHVEHLWTVLCREVQPADNGSFSLVGVMDAVRLANLPPGEVSLRLPCVVVSGWRRNLEPGATVHERLLFEYRADNYRVPLTESRAIILEAKHLSYSITEIRVLPIRGYGQYMFVVQRQEGDAWRDVSPTAGLWVASPHEWPEPT
jgi:hypothetical protein